MREGAPRSLILGGSSSHANSWLVNRAGGMQLTDGAGILPDPAALCALLFACGGAAGLVPNSWLALPFHSLLPTFPLFFFPKITCQSWACFQCVGAQIRWECQGQADSKGRDNNSWLLFPLWNCWVYQIRDWGLSKAFGSQKVPRSHSQLGFNTEEVGETPGNHTIPSGGNGGGNVAPLSPSRPPGHTFWLLWCWERFSVWKIPPGAGEAGNLSPAQTSRIISHSCNSLINILQAKGMKSPSPPPCARGQILELL